MSLPDEPRLTGEILEESSALSVSELTRLIAVEERHIVEWVQEGVINVRDRCRRVAIQRCAAAPGRIALRLERDLGVNACRRGAGARIAGGAQGIAARAEDGPLMSALQIGRLRVLRRDRRPCIQAGVSGAQLAGQPGRSRDSHHRHGARRVEHREAARPGAGELGARGKVLRRGIRETVRADALRRRRLLGSGDVSKFAQGARFGGASDSLPRHTAKHVRPRRTGTRRFWLRPRRACHRREAFRAGSRDGTGAR